MERMALAARAAGKTPDRWIMTLMALETLRTAAREMLEMDAPQLQDIDPPEFMGLLIEIGSTASDDPPVELITRSKR